MTWKYVKSEAIGARYFVSDRATSQKVDYSVYVAISQQVVEIWKEPVDFNDGFLGWHEEHCPVVGYRTHVH